MSPKGTWWDLQEPSVRFPSTVFGPVHPFGVRRRIIGHRGRAVLPALRASRWMERISATTVSIVVAIERCIVAGSSPSTKCVAYP